MGAYAPVSLVRSDVAGEITRRILRPTLQALRANAAPFTGLLYAGLMLTRDGPKVVEFNCRFGDPETEAVLVVSRPSTPPLVDIMLAAARGEPCPDPIAMNEGGYAVTTVLASAGYPDSSRVGDVITIPPVPNDVFVFHAGTRRREDGALVTSGGRVLAITAWHERFDEAQRKSREFASRVEFAGKQFRTDIGWRELERQMAGHAGAS
jgi:phosphoribosylamine--glycine ligase